MSAVTHAHTVDGARCCCGRAVGEEHASGCSYAGLSLNPTSAVELDQGRTYPADAAARLGALWRSVAAEYGPPPSGRGYLDWFRSEDLPADVCRGTTPEGRRFVAFKLRTFLDGEEGVPEVEVDLDDVAAGYDGVSVGVAHERYVDNQDKWVWAGTSCGALAGHADPDLCEALARGKVVRLRGGMADGYELRPVYAPARRESLC